MVGGISSRHGGLPGIDNGPFIPRTDSGHHFSPSGELRYSRTSTTLMFSLLADWSLGVPDREEQDELLGSLPSYFESRKIHIAGLIAASYSGEEYSHYLAKSSLGTWLKEQGVPAIHGVDTRTLTKKIRTQGSMLGRMLLQKNTGAREVILNSDSAKPIRSHDWRFDFETQDWVDPNSKNLVAEGRSLLLEALACVS